jgi:hypothetical protein
VLPLSPVLPLRPLSPLSPVLPLRPVSPVLPLWPPHPPAPRSSRLPPAQRRALLARDGPTVVWFSLLVWRLVMIPSLHCAHAAPPLR